FINRVMLCNLLLYICQFFSNFKPQRGQDSIPFRTLCPFGALFPIWCTYFIFKDGKDPTIPTSSAYFEVAFNGSIDGVPIKEKYFGGFIERKTKSEKLGVELFIEPQIEKSPGAGVCLPEQVSQEFPCMGLSCDDQVGYQRATFGALEQFGRFPVRFNVQQTQQFELQRHKLIPFIKSTHLPHMAGFGTYPVFQNIYGLMASVTS
ncbi:MAG: hypothetical protein WBL25_01600, partial [Anaerolineales bacterium]